MFYLLTYLRVMPVWVLLLPVVCPGEQPPSAIMAPGRAAAPAVKPRKPAVKQDSNKTASPPPEVTAAAAADVVAATISMSPSASAQNDKPKPGQTLMSAVLGYFFSLRFSALDGRFMTPFSSTNFCLQPLCLTLHRTCWLHHLAFVAVSFLL